MKPSKPIVVYSDSSSAINLSANPVFHERSKHIANKWHFIRELMYDGLLTIEKIDTFSNVADALTKAVPEPKLAFSKLGMGMSPLAFFAFFVFCLT